MTLERAREVCRVFGLREIPDHVPFVAAIGLDLPARPLTEREITLIAAAAAGPLFEHAPWQLGDLLVYLREHPEAPISYETLVGRLRKLGFKDQTLYNYKSVAMSYPLSERCEGLPLSKHSILRTLPSRERAELLKRGLAEGLTPDQLRDLRDAYCGLSETEALAAQVELAGRQIRDAAARPTNAGLMDAIARCESLLEELRARTRD